MFNIDFSSKRARLAIRFFTYGVMAVTSAALTIVLVFVALGYRLDRNLNFAQGGLVQFRSYPESASVTVDGKKQGFRTPDKANLAAGSHTIAMSLTGYHSWTKTTDLAAGQLLWLNYARLIPTSITTSTLKEYQSIDSTLPSPDRKWLLMHMSADSPTFTLVDFENEKQPEYTSLQLPEAAFTKKDGKYGSFKLLEWDLQSKYVLIEHDNGDTVEFARLDRSKPSDTLNLTKIFGLNIREAHFSGNNASIIFARTDDVLRRLDVGASSASGALVGGLQRFMVYGEDTIAFTNVREELTGDKASQQQLVGIYRNGKVTTVRELPVDQQATIAYNEYDNHSYLAITESKSTRVDIIRDATVTGTSKQATVFAQFDLGAEVKSLSFSSNGRMLVAQNGQKLATYDIETAKTYIPTLNFGSDKMSELKWLDDYYLYSDADGQLRIFEFDGTNQHEITGVKPGYDSMLSPNGKQLLSIGTNEVTKTLLLQSSKLTLDN